MKQFIEHNKLFEFVDICQMYNIGGTEKFTLDLNSFLENTGKNYLHIAIDSRAKEIISYLLFDVKVDPNILTKDE